MDKPAGGFTAFYPEISIGRIEHPNRWYAAPFLGYIVKLVLLTPSFIILIFLSLVAGILTFISSFSVLFTGKYLNEAYDYNQKAIRYTLKVMFYLNGLTDTYPGFSTAITDPYSVTVPKPANPSRWFAFPVLGGMVRVFLLIPFIIWSAILSYGSGPATAAASVPVLFKGYYPESIYEFNRDLNRIGMASMCYLYGLSDKYPSFKISWNHKVIKILLIITGILLLLARTARQPAPHPQYQRNYVNSSLQQNP